MRARSLLRCRERRMRAAYPIARWAAFVLAFSSWLAVTGCPDSHVVVDGGFALVDGALVPCTIRGLPRCDEICGGETVCRASAQPNDGCVGGLCLPREPHTDGRNNVCGGFQYCFDGRVCDLGLFDGIAGACVDESLCDAAEAAGLRLPCVWSDGTPRVRGAPAEPATCPAAPHPETPFCGGPCGDCGPYSPNFRPVDSNLLHPACVGRSDTRGVGICGLNYVGNCLRGVNDGTDICVYGGISVPELRDTTCICVVFRGADTVDGLSDFGWATSTEGCRAYRDRYPDDVECVVDRAWNPLP